MKKISMLSFASALLFSTSINAASVYVKSIDVSGLQRVEKETVLSYIDLSSGENVSSEHLDEALKQLYATGLFADVAFDVDGANVLNIKVVEK